MNPDEAISPAPESEISFIDRVTNVIAAPGEAFAGMQNAPVRVVNWLVPLSVSCIATVIYLVITFSQPAVLQVMQQQTATAYKAQIAAGKMTQAQAETAENFMTPTIYKLLGVAGGIVSSFAGIFLLAVLLWLALKWAAGAKVGFMKVVEVYGLSLVIDVLQKIIRSFLVIWKENMLATVSPALFVTNASSTNKMHLALASLDLIDIWWLAVLSVGLSKVAGVSYRAAAFVAFGVWFGSRILWIVLTPTR